jgi:hypothetical protein
MPITSIPESIAPALWTYTYLQAPINGQGFTYFNIPSAVETKGNIAAGATATCDISSFNVFAMTCLGNMTLAFSNIPTTAKAAFWQVEIKAGGSYSVTYPASVKWDGGGASNVAPLLSTNTTVLNFYTRDGGSTIYGSYAFADLNV